MWGKESHIWKACDIFKGNVQNIVFKYPQMRNNCDPLPQIHEF